MKTSFVVTTLVILNLIFLIAFALIAFSPIFDLWMFAKAQPNICTTEIEGKIVFTLCKDEINDAATQTE